MNEIKQKIWDLADAIFTSKDPEETERLYQEFDAWYKTIPHPTLSPEEIEERNQILRNIMRDEFGIV